MYAKNFARLVTYVNLTPRTNINNLKTDYYVKRLHVVEL